ncbi:MAG: hypothetical protein ACHP8A_02410 [Terriglobales bacterium]|jgi:hypothetical protein
MKSARLQSVAKLIGIICPLFLMWAQIGVAQNSANSSIQLVREAVHNEISNSRSGPNFMFREVSQGSDGSKTKLLVETRDAMAGLLIATNGHPLTADQRQAEQKRLEHLVNDPGDLDKKCKREKEDAERTQRIMGAFPEAFLYEEDGTASGEEGLGAPGDPLVRLKFRPNPKYSPPSHVEQILTGLQGTMLIDGKQHRIAKIDGTLMKEVGFGWGILGHLDRGGHFIVQQGDMGGGHWEITRMDLSFTGKALFFKTLNIKDQEVYSDFQPAPRGLTFAQGVELLKKHEALIAQNQPPER